MVTTTEHDPLAVCLRSPEDLAVIESVPLSDRDLPVSGYAALCRRARLTPDRPAATFIPGGDRYDQGVTYTYAELADGVIRCANAFVELGVRRGQAVALLSGNCSQLLTALLAAETVGVAAPLNPGLSVERLESLLRLGGADVLVAAGPELDEQIWELALQLATRVGLRAVLAVRPDGRSVESPVRPALTGAGRTRVAYLEDVLPEGSRPRLLCPAPGADDLASYFHTGGTTGAPKVAAHTHRNESVVAWGLAISRSLPDDAVVLAGLPLFHVNALIVTTLAPLLYGQHVLWTGPLGYRDISLYQNFWRLIQHHRVAGMSAVPTVYAVLNQTPVDADISSLTTAAVGAAPLPESVRRDFEKHTGVELLEGYGLTEAGCASARSLPGHRRQGSVGQRMPYQQIKAVAVDPDTGAWQDLPSNEAGLLVISGPAVFPGYLERGPEGVAPDPGTSVRDGWLDTGDLGYVDDEGFVYLVGRMKDLIIRGGHNIDPTTIEDALLEHPSVLAAAAVGRPDRHSGEIPVAYVTTASPVVEEDLVAWAAARITERGAAPRYVHVVESLPLTLIGKRDKQALRADSIRRVVLDEIARSSAVHDASLHEVAVDMQTPDGVPCVSVTGIAEGDDALVMDALKGYRFEARTSR